MAAQLLSNFKHLKGLSTLPLISEKRQITYKILKGCRVAKASVVGLFNLCSNLQIIILCF